MSKADEKDIRHNRCCGIDGAAGSVDTPCAHDL